MFRKCWEKEEREEGVNKEKKTSDEMKKVMDSIFSNLNFEMETPMMFENGRLPTLDFECFVSENKVLYSFYEKPMAKKTLIQRKSALGENVKIASLTQNLIRRMKNTSELLPDGERILIVERYVSQLKLLGYSEVQTKRIIEAGLKGYETLLSKCLKGTAKMHRSAEEGAEFRKVKKLLGKSRWFKKKRKKEGKKSKKQKEESPEIVTVIFVPQTPKGELAKRLQIVENKISKLTGERVKIVERGGTQVKQILVKSNPWSKGFCDRANCLPCLNGDGNQNCFDKNVVYQISCLECAERHGEDQERKTAIYIGQTSRSIYERGQEHLLCLRKKQENSPLFKHASEEHAGDSNIRFEMKVVKKHFSAISRLVHEAILIERTSGAKSYSILNSKGEWGRTHLPRLKLDDSMNESKANMVMQNNFTEQEEGWNVLEARNRKVEVKRKASSEKDADDNEPLSSNNKPKTFSFSSNDIESSKAASKLNSNFGGVTKHKKQTDLFRFVAAKPNFKCRKKIKLSD